MGGIEGARERDLRVSFPPPFLFCCFSFSPFFPSSFVSPWFFLLSFVCVFFGFFFSPQGTLPFLISCSLFILLCQRRENSRTLFLFFFVFFALCPRGGLTIKDVRDHYKTCVKKRKRKKDEKEGFPLACHICCQSESTILANFLLVPSVSFLFVFSLSLLPLAKHDFYSLCPASVKLFCFISPSCRQPFQQKINQSIISYHISSFPSLLLCLVMQIQSRLHTAFLSCSALWRYSFSFQTPTHLQTPCANSSLQSSYYFEPAAH
jgi:hypothetical protein